MQPQCIDQQCAHVSYFDRQNGKAWEDAEYKPILSAQAEAGNVSVQSDGEVRTIGLTIGPFKIDVVIKPDPPKEAKVENRE